MLSPVTSRAVPVTIGGGTASSPLLSLAGVSAGNSYRIAPGSTVGGFTPTGTVQIERLDADGAVFFLDATAAGKRMRVRMTVKRAGDGRVIVSTQDLGSGRSRSGVGTIVKSQPNYSQFVSVDGRERTTISKDGAAIVITTKVPQLGAAHLILR